MQTHVNWVLATEDEHGELLEPPDPRARVVRSRYHSEYEMPPAFALELISLFAARIPRTAA